MSTTATSALRGATAGVELEAVGSGGLRVLTLQQPWAWAVIFAGKSVENRTQSMGAYRGPVAIHAGTTWSRFGARYLQRLGIEPPDDLVRGAVIGVVDLVDQHHAGDPGCSGPAGCSPWAMTHPDLTGGTGNPARRMAHLELANPRPLAEPVPARGRLSLWKPDAQLAAQVRTQIPAPSPARKDEHR